MKSFLEFVCETLMGPPKGSRSWNCPFHPDNTPSFSVNPPKQRPDGGWYAIKFRCHAGSCNAMGDEWDLLKHFYPQSTYDQKLKIFRSWEVQYERLYGIKPDISKRPSLPTGDRGEDADQLRYCCAELRSVIRERGVNWKDEEAGFIVLAWADRIATDQGVSLEAFARQAASEVISNRGANRGK